MLMDYGKNPISAPRKSQPSLSKPIGLKSVTKLKKVTYVDTNPIAAPSNDLHCPEPNTNELSVNQNPPNDTSRNSVTNKNTLGLDNKEPRHSVSSFNILKDDLVLDYEEGGNLNPLSDFLKTRTFKAESYKIQQTFIKVYQASQKMETKIKNCISEIKRLSTLNKYLFSTQKHKEEMLCKVLEENRRLTEDLTHTKMLLNEKIKKEKTKSQFPGDVQTNIEQSMNQSFQGNKSLNNSFRAGHSNSKIKIQGNIQNERHTVPVVSNTNVGSSHKLGTSYLNPASFTNPNSKKRNQIPKHSNQSSSVTIKKCLSICKTCGNEIIQKDLENNKQEVPMLIHEHLDAIIESTTLSAYLFRDDIFEQLRKANDSNSIIDQILQSNENYAHLRSQTENEDNLKNYIIGMTHSSLSQLYDYIRGLLGNVSCIFKMGMRIKKIFDATPEITGNLTTNEAMAAIVEHITDSLECERATVFKLDLLRGELWSQAAKGHTQIMQLPMNKGIAGYAATNKQKVNIRDAYSDERFDQTYDQKTGFRTKSILVIPILNKMNEIEGIIQAVNKKPDKNNVFRFFSKDDEGLLTILANIAGVTVKNSSIYNEQVVFHNSLRSILKVGIYLNTYKNQRDLGKAAEIKLCHQFNTEQSRIYFLDKTGEYVFRYDYENENKDKIFKFKKGSGILSQAIIKNSIIIISSPSLETNFNALIDIEGTMPMLVVPIKCSITQKIIGCFEVINTRGIEGLSSTGQAKLNSKDYEIVDFFSSQLAQCVLNLTNTKCSSLAIGVTENESNIGSLNGFDGENPEYKAKVKNYQQIHEGDGIIDLKNADEFNQGLKVEKSMGQ